MKNKKDRSRKEQISGSEFVRADEFNEYNVPVPDSMRRRKKKKPERFEQQDTRMPERREAERRLRRQREQLETLEYIRGRELAREQEVIQQKRIQELMRERDEQSGGMTVTEIEPPEKDDAQQDIPDTVYYEDDKPSFTYLKMQDGRISEDSGEDIQQELSDEQMRERIRQSFDGGRDSDENEFSDESELYPEYDGYEDDPDLEQGEAGRSHRRIKHKVTPETATVTDIAQERKKEKTRRHLKRLVVLLFVAAIGLTVFLTASWWIPKLEGILDKPHDTIVNDGKTEGGNFPLKISQSGISDITQCNDIMVTLDGNKVVFYKKDGSQLSSIPHNYGSPVIDVCAKKIVAYDNAGKSFQVLNKKNTVYSKKTDQPIVMAKIGSNGYVAVVTQTEKYSAFVTVYDESGAEIYTWASNRRVVGICFNEDGKGCCISAISSSGGKINSVIYSVKFDSKEAVMTSAPIDCLVIQARLTKNNKYWVVGDDRFMVLDEVGNTLYNYQYDTDLVAFDMDERYAALYNTSVTQTHGSVTMFDCEDDEEKPCLQKDIQGKPRKLQLNDGNIIVFTDTSVESYDPKGHQLATASISGGYVGIVYADDAVYLMGYRDINKIKFET